MEMRFEIKKGIIKGGGKAISSPGQSPSNENEDDSFIIRNETKSEHGFVANSHTFCPLLV